MTAIETREIKGINLRNIITIVIATGSIVTTVLVSYANLSAQNVKTQNSVERMQLRVDSDARYLDLRMSVMEKTLTLLQLQIDNLKK